MGWDQGGAPRPRGLLSEDFYLLLLMAYCLKWLMSMMRAAAAIDGRVEKIVDNWAR